MLKNKSKNNYMFIFTILLALLLLFLFQGIVSANCDNTKVVITGNWVNAENRETTVVLTNLTTGSVYNGILKYGKELIFKSINYGTYKITCENTLDIAYEGSNILNDEFTLDATNQVEEITVTNKSIKKGGFYNIQEVNNRIKIDSTPADITLEGEDTIILPIGAIYNEPGYTAYDHRDGDITSSVVVTGELDTTKEGEYILKYTVTNSRGIVTEATRTVKVIGLFYYTGDYQTYIVPMDGIYTIELWGASGRTEGNMGEPGRGGYTSGTIYLTKGEILYMYVGESGNNVSNPSELSFNGGGETHNVTDNYSKGGGATDVRLVSGAWDDYTGLNSRIMVAGGRWWWSG